MTKISKIQGLLLALVAMLLCAGCELDPGIKYYKVPTIENVAISHDLAAVTPNDDVHISATVTNSFGVGFVGVRYWVCTNDWGTTLPEMKFINEALYKWVEPQGEQTDGSWKKLASLSSTYTYTCPSCGNATLTKPATCTECNFKEDKENKFASNYVAFEAGKPFAFEAVIPKQKAGKFVMFTVYCTSEYGIFSSSDYYSYTVQP